ncbi:putative 3-methyl-2-oxobutanoate hydroxymethyltransferase [Aspergillus nomiae NRRL 13137]|uniref:3-methyl-2-oxobutanoate hydroxymethyltransferase n=1 Tax=Aspergillus nomiae NRRL (strain ATCC 15546 / NRRL 13137 / CBS 260.88 / M93) TaxID=1509407 RepID=A0A0L1JBF0_ASPN3|nr:putative 3-methyl-2-oxobutanoate hydroxymethyltransferase [Aspergillus nomiae NRRL 13137]KNG89035.1 putative 3-methyl-2-oxobutanoate hydroxymethyltransferase [Aspergillus nomiae NRRL 13137]
MLTKSLFASLTPLRHSLRPRYSVSARLPLPSNVVVRYSSYSPLGKTSSDSRKKVTIQTLQTMYKKGDPITVLTAHDFPSGHVADAAGMDVVLVGDSLAMVALGMEDTNEVAMEDMLVHCRSVSHSRPPHGSYELSPEQALQSAIRMVKEGGMKAVKLEGGQEMAPTIRRITQAGIPVLAHIGLTPQRHHSIGGFRVQGKSVAGAVKVMRDALAVQEAGAFMVLVEAVPGEVAALITERLRVPTIGIGAGVGCSGQVLVQVDMLGNFSPGRFVPKFVKTYADVWGESIRGIEEFKRDVKSRAFPSREYTYPISEQELLEFRSVVGEVVDQESGHSE